MRRSSLLLMVSGAGSWKRIPIGRDTVRFLSTFMILQQWAATQSLWSTFFLLQKPPCRNLLLKECMTPRHSFGFLLSGDTCTPMHLTAVSYTHLRAHETDSYLVCRLLLEKKKK